MTYLLIYCLGFLITLWLLILLDKAQTHDFTSLFSISLVWPVTVPVYILFITYDFIIDLFREFFKEEPDDEDALRDYRGLPHTPKPEKKPKEFKFGR